MYEEELYIDKEGLAQSILDIWKINNHLIYGVDFSAPFVSILNNLSGELQSNVIDEIYPIINLLSRNLDMYKGFVDNTVMSLATAINKVSDIDIDMSTQINNK